MIRTTMIEVAGSRFGRGREGEEKGEREKEGQKADEKASHVCGVRFWPAEEGEMERGDL